MIWPSSFLHRWRPSPDLPQGLTGVEAARLSGPRLSTKAFALLVGAFDDVDVSAVTDASPGPSDGVVKLSAAFDGRPRAVS